MPNDSVLSHYFTFGGADDVTPSELVQASGYEMACNIVLKEGRATTRFGINGIDSDVSRISEESASSYFKGNGQGFLFHNPSKGQSGQIFGRDSGYIMSAYEGRKYAVEILGSGRNAKARVNDVTGTIRGNRQLHLVWWGSAENYALANDGFNNLVIWDGNNTFSSPGYNTTNKENSKLPNGGTVILYIHGRIAIVVNSRYIIYGDIIHKESRFDPSNILETTEQVHWATGPFILPPSSMGNILAAEKFVASGNEEHGHGEAMYFCEDGVFSVDTNISVRERWAETKMVRHALIDTSCTGPYALATVDGDIIFRSLNGIESIRSGITEVQSGGIRDLSVGQKISNMLEKDPQPHLRFCSLVNWQSKQRTFCTIDPVVRGRYRYHNAIVSKLHDPTSTQESPAAWEGMFTFPKEYGGIIQMVKGRWSGRERIFALTREDNVDDAGNGYNGIVEFDEASKTDFIQDKDGSFYEKPISSWLKTRAVSFGQPFLDKSMVTGALLFKDIYVGVNDFRWSVSVRTEEEKNWTLWNKGKISLTRTDGLSVGSTMDRDISVGSLTDVKLDRSKRYQFLIKWEGYASLDSFLVQSHKGRAQNEFDFDPNGDDVKVEPLVVFDHDEYEYTKTSKGERVIEI